jgi:DNA-binding protein YbaB
MIVPGGDAEGRPGAGAPVEVRGVGEAADGQVRAVTAGSRLDRLDVEPRLMRGRAEELAAHILSAVNAAFADLRARSPSVAPVDVAVLVRTLSEVQGEGLRSLAAITRALSDAVEQLRERTGMTGDVGTKGLESLVEQTQGTVDALRGDAQDAPDVVGRGEGADGSVVAVVPPGGRVESLEIDQRAMRMASAELAEQVVVAVNAALEDLRARSREQMGALRVDAERLTALRDQSTEQMTAYARSLNALISSIQPR